MSWYYWFIDYWYIVLVLPAILLGLIAQIGVKVTYSKYAKVGNARGMTADEVARRILDSNGLHDVAINRVGGELTDHYDPRSRTVNLSQSVYGNTSVAAIGVAAHEVGHAIQHSKNYVPMRVRSAIIPVTNIGSTISPIVILLGFLFSYEPLIYFGIGLYSLVALFQLVTLPVEFNASRRALVTLEHDGILSHAENAGARKVLTAAAMTYVAALVVTLMHILRLILIFGGGRRRN